MKTRIICFASGKLGFHVAVNLKIFNRGNEKISYKIQTSMFNDNLEFSLESSVPGMNSVVE